MKKPNIVVICGPTGLGKTAVAIKLAEIFHGEIINADSMQIYKFMDIGTAKPTPHEQACISHHLIDIVKPNQLFDAAQFAKAAHKIAMTLHTQNIIPFVVGGTGLYIKALVYGLCDAAPADIDIRNKLKAETVVNAPDFLYKKLSKHDPEAAKKIHINDAYRIIRALEVYEITGKTVSEYRNEHKFLDAKFNVLKIGLFMDRKAMYDRINRRVDEMIEAGLVNEVKGLLDKGYDEKFKSMLSLGYRHIVDFIHGNCSWDETVRTLKRDTRRYAKRQITWFKTDSEIVWLEPHNLESMKNLIMNFLN